MLIIRSFFRYQYQISYTIFPLISDHYPKVPDKRADEINVQAGFFFIILKNMQGLINVQTGFFQNIFNKRAELK